MQMIHRLAPVRTGVDYRPVAVSELFRSGDLIHDGKQVTEQGLVLASGSNIS